MTRENESHPLFEDSWQHLAAIIASSQDAIISKALDGTIRTWNPAAERIFGYAASEIVGQSIMVLIPPERQHDEDLIREKIRNGERLSHYETVRRRKDGALIDVSITVSPMFDDKGEVIGASKIARDITERKRADEHKALLLGEMKHRTRNFQAILDAIARQTVRDDPSAAAALNLFVGRIKALLLTGEVIVDSETRSANLGVLFSAALAPFRGKDASTIRIEGTDFEVPEITAGNLVLAVHELATNAVKYGALRTPEGRVALTWDRNGDHIRIVWEEHSNNFEIPTSSKTGFGTKVIGSALAHEKGGRTEYSYGSDGVRCAFEFSRG
jgi:two-component system CheB/CheR fusion protein